MTVQCMMAAAVVMVFVSAAMVAVNSLFVSMCFVVEILTMPLRVRQDEEPGMNLTPMIDVVMLLNIFFMVGSRLVEPEKQYDINLPTVTDARPLTALPDEIVLNVKDDGTVLVKGQVKDSATLETDLKQAIKRYADQVVRIRGDGQGPYQHVMTTLSLCQKSGVTRIKLDAQLEVPQAP